MTATNHISLSQLQQRIKGVIEQSLPLPVWVTAEISELKVNYSGHCYMELVEKANAGGKQTSGKSQSSSIPKAQARAVIWRSQYSMISAYFEAETGSKLTAGMSILAKVLVTYHEMYGLSLQITDIDASYTLGEVERQRQLTIKQLQADGVWDMNRETEMPMLVQRLAVVSSVSAAGYRDFCNELKSGGYAFSVELFEAVMQGQAAEESVCAALEQIAQRQDKFDAVVVIRGGGSTSDLSCFNSYKLCSYVAQFPLAIITGIGHDKDTSVADMVAHTPLKTPTAVAGWLTERMARIDGWLEDSLHQLHSFATSRTQHQLIELERARAEIGREIARVVERARTRLELSLGAISMATEQLIQRQRSRLELALGVIEARSPEQILKMGFAIVRQKGRALLSTSEVRQSEPVEIELPDGKIRAQISEIIKR